MLLLLGVMVFAAILLVYHLLVSLPPRLCNSATIDEHHRIHYRPSRLLPTGFFTASKFSFEML
jgi:hypothetical protein